MRVFPDSNACALFMSAQDLVRMAEEFLQGQMGF